MENNETPAWEPPPPPEKIEKVAELAQMSEVSTLLNIFIEPGRTFDDLRRKPRFILVTILIALLSGGWMFGLYQKVGETALRQTVVQQVDKSLESSSVSPEQREGIISMNMSIQKAMPLVVPVIIIISMFIGGLFYFLGGKAFGGSGGFFHGVSVFAYSWLPPALVSLVANVVILLFKPAEDIDLLTAPRGLVKANPSMFIDAKEMPALATLLGSFDLFMIWGWILAAIGLRITNKISSGSAWAITIIFALIGVLFRVVGAFFSGNPS